MRRVSQLLLSVVFVALFVSSSLCTTALAQEPGWYPRTFVSEQQRKQIEATPIEKRPYRPLHFYGNFVRRNYYRGNQRLAQRFNANNVYASASRATTGTLRTGR